MAYTEKTTVGDTLIYFVFDVNQNDGWVIVSADDASVPIIGYSFTGHYVNDRISSEYWFWMDHYKKQILNIKKNNLPPTAEIIDQWQNYKSNNVSKTTQSFANIGPLLNTNWGQGKFYNFYCPSDTRGDGGHTPTGCTATAMAQILKYWGDKIGHPTQGVGSHTDYTSYGALSVNFGAQTYNWAAMLNNITSSNYDAVAILMYHCGVSLDMQYGSSVINGTLQSGAPMSSAAYVNYFGYDPTTIRDLFKNSYQESYWINNILKPELDNGRPIQYGGVDYNNGAHSWVCDGYRSSDNYFHMNWGWGDIPSNAGYFSISSLNPYNTNYNFNFNHEAIIGIQFNGYCYDPWEANDNPASATLVFHDPLTDSGPDYTMHGNIGWNGDQDWYRINIGRSGTLTINLTNLPFDYDLELYGPGVELSGSGGLLDWISRSDNSGTQTEKIIYNYTGSSTRVYAKVYPSPKNPSAYTTSSCYNIEFIWTQNSSPNTYSINTFSNPQAGGRTSGGGNFPFGQDITIVATSNPGYTFINWTEDGSPLTTLASFPIKVVKNRNLVANFTTCNYTLNSNNVTLYSPAQTYNFWVYATSDCSWTATTSGCNDMISLTKATGSGNGMVTFNLSENKSTAPRSCTITVGGQTFTVTQNGYNAPCASPPIAATNLTADVIYSDQIYLSWYDNSTTETKFEIERGLSSTGPFSIIAIVDANISGYQDKNVLGGTTYFYRVRACCNSNCSDFTNVVSKLACTYSKSATTIIASADTIFQGDSVCLAVQGGSLGTGATWTWRTTHCDDGTLVGTGSSITVAPTISTTYVVNPEGGNCKMPAVICASAIITVKQSPTDISDNNKINSPKFYCIYQNYPNPFNPSTIIKYQIPNAGMVFIKVYDMLGREVKTLAHEYKNAGSYTIEFDASNLASGIYFYKLITGDFTDTKKLLLIK